MMRRNLDNRVELVTPVDDESLKDQLFDTLGRSFADNTNGWRLGSDGVWERPELGPGEQRHGVQDELMEHFRKIDEAFSA